MTNTSDDFLIKQNGMLIVISGLSACGKTSFINKLKDKKEVRSVPSSSSIRDKSKNFPNISETYEDALEKQKYYFELDKQVSSIAKNMKQSGGVVLGDRDYLSALAHNYATGKQDSKTDVFPWMAKEYSDALFKGELVVPDLHIYLDVPTEERKKRALSEPSRQRDDCFFEDTFSNNMRDFYKGALNHIPSKWVDYSSKDAVSEVIEIINNFKPSNQKTDVTNLANFIKESAKKTDGSKGVQYPFNGRDL